VAELALAEEAVGSGGYPANAGPKVQDWGEPDAATAEEEAL
jgi:hypothetical protein